MKIATSSGVKALLVLTRTKSWWSSAAIQASISPSVLLLRSRPNSKRRRRGGVRQILQRDGAVQLARRGGEVAALIVGALGIECLRQMDPGNRRVHVMNAVQVEVEQQFGKWLGKPKITCVENIADRGFVMIDVI